MTIFIRNGEELISDLCRFKQMLHFTPIHTYIVKTIQMNFFSSSLKLNFVLQKHFELNCLTY